MGIRALKLIKGLTAALLLFAAAFSVYFSFNAVNSYNSKIEARLLSFLRYSSVKPRFIKFADFNFDTLASDYFWMLFVQETSSYRLSRMRYPYMYRITSATVILNPNFNYAYQAGGTLLGLSGKPRRAIRLLKKGMAHLKGNWNIPFLIAFNYFYNLGDFPKAARYLKYAVDMKGSPKYLEFLYMKLLNKSGNLKQALSFLDGMYRNNSNPIIRHIIRIRIRAVEKEIELKKEHKKYNIPYSLKLFMMNRNRDRLRKKVSGGRTN